MFIEGYFSKFTLWLLEGYTVLLEKGSGWLLRDGNQFLDLMNLSQSVTSLFWG